MKIKHSPLFLILIFLFFLQIVMLMAVGIAPVAQSADVSMLPLSSTSNLSATVAELAAQADLIVQARVIEARSRWNHDHTLIETAQRLAVQQRFAGPALAEVVVYTDGGFLADEGLGMFSSHTPRFAIGEEVLVFLQKRAAGYQVVNGEGGKFTVFQGNAASAYYRDHLPLTEVVAALATANRTTQQVIPLGTPEPVGGYAADSMPSNRMQPLATATPTPLPKWSSATPKINVQVNLNSTQIGGQAGTAEQFSTAINNALRTWSVIPEAGATLLYNGPITSTTTSLNRISEILFMKNGTNGRLGQAQIWFTSSFVIIEADLWINDDYVLDATGSPAMGEIDLESVVLHELGHWLPLNHMPNTNAVMYAVLGSGMRKTVLNNDDIAGVTALYPCPTVPCIDPAYAGATPPTPTVTVTVTLEPAITPTATITPDTVTPTPTLIPTAVPSAAKQNSFLPLVTR